MLSSIVPPFLFFVLPVVVPLLLSFPTRRSSDLPSAHSRRRRRWPRPRTGPGPAACPPRDRGPRRSADRKSTRLNSSHLVISYAAFCLKKKNSNNCYRITYV